MKLNYKNPIHWITVFIFFINCLLIKMLSIFLKRNNSLTFTGQFFSENIEILINNNYKNYKNYYFSYNIFEKKK